MNEEVKMKLKQWVKEWMKERIRIFLKQWVKE